MAKSPTETGVTVIGWMLRKSWIALFCLMAAILFTRPHFPSGDVDELFVQYRAFTEQGTLFLDHYGAEIPPERREVNPDGRLISRYAPGYPLLAAVWWKIAGVLGLQKVWVERHHFLFAGAWIFFFSGYLLSRELSRLSRRRFWNRVVVWAWLFGTFASYYAWTWPANTLEGALILISALFALRVWTWPEANYFRDKACRWAGLSGLALGLAILCRAFPVVLFPVFLAFFLARRKWLASLFFIFGVGVFIGLYLYINWLKLGRTEIAWTLYVTQDAFSTPFYVGFLGSLFWPAKSFIYFAPVAVLGLLGLPRLIARMPWHGMLCVLVSVIYIVAMSKWWAWWSGPDMGQRFWIPVIPFLLMPLVALRRFYWKVLVMGALLWGMALQLEMWPSDPGAIYKNIYTKFPWSEETAAVRQVLWEGKWPTVLYRTFVEDAYRRAAHAVRESKRSR